MHPNRLPERRARDVRAENLAIAPGPSFARGLWRIAAADVWSINRVRLLRDGPATFAAMRELIEQARTSVALERHIFGSEEVGHRLGEAVAKAAGWGGA